jgi:hypothetical protein
VGTLDYIAPEQIDGQRIDGRADLYSLGCAAYELLSGRPPFRPAEGLALVRAHLSEPPPELTAERRDLPGVIDRVLAGAMAKDPGQRYPSCARFAADLGRALGLVPGDPAPPDVGGRPRPGAPTQAVRPGPAAAPTLAPAGSGGPRARAPGDGGAWPQRPRQPRPQAARRRSRRAVAAGVAAGVALLAAGAAGAVLIGRGPGPGGGAGTSAAARAQAAHVNRLLSSGTGANAGLTEALAAAGACASVTGSIGELTRIRDQRRTEYEQVQVMPVSLLPQGGRLKLVLAQALYYSLQADDAYLNWASRQDQGGCQASSAPLLPDLNPRATSFKDQFAQLWNPVALRFGFVPRSLDSI